MINNRQIKWKEILSLKYQGRFLKNKKWVKCLEDKVFFKGKLLKQTQVMI
jgi:hypothetical protein